MLRRARSPASEVTKVQQLAKEAWSVAAWVVQQRERAKRGWSGAGCCFCDFALGVGWTRGDRSSRLQQVETVDSVIRKGGGERKREIG